MRGPRKLSRWNWVGSLVYYCFRSATLHLLVDTKYFKFHPTLHCNREFDRHFQCAELQAKTWTTPRHLHDDLLHQEKLLKLSRCEPPSPVDQSLSRARDAPPTANDVTFLSSLLALRHGVTATMAVNKRWEERSRTPSAIPQHLLLLSRPRRRSRCISRLLLSHRCASVALLQVFTRELQSILGSIFDNQ